MADVFQIIATDENHRNYEEGIVSEGAWHASIIIDSPRTICGIQLEGEDGYSPGPEKKGKVTCQICRSIIEQIQSIKRWK